MLLKLVIIRASVSGMASEGYLICKATFPSLRGSESSSPWHKPEGRSSMNYLTRKTAVLTSAWGSKLSGKMVLRLVVLLSKALLFISYFSSAFPDSVINAIDSI